MGLLSRIMGRGANHPDPEKGRINADPSAIDRSESRRDEMHAGPGNGRRLVVPIEKKIVVDKIEVMESGVVHVRTATKIIEDGVVISKSFHRHVVIPGADYSNEDARVQAICKIIHTPEVIAAYTVSISQGV